MDSLNIIKAHANFPFRRYREDPAAHGLCERYWAALFASVTAGIDGDWEPWLQPDTDRDGSGIFSAVCRSRDQGVIINQYMPTAADVSWRDGGTYHPFVAWIDTLGDETDPIIEHLTLNSAISGDGEAFCRFFLNAYLVRRLPRSQLEAQIRQWEKEHYG
ncbi:MAG: hypothetical protein H7338_08840 [Candidatus Sericytochromatia bacterium]|nr:hypothetical protein [Candidatus Sericytochromatia bacterium]